ncbi:MAG: hypothetical protein ACI83D_000720 [Planctomycetota bacterium]|jgi:hypothetical protein
MSKLDTNNKVGNSKTMIQEEALKDITTISLQKPMGNMPISTLNEAGIVDIEVLRIELENKGLTVLVLTEGAATVSGGQVIVFNEQYLSDLIGTPASNQILVSSFWPTLNTEQFARACALVTAPPGSPLAALIGKAFGDIRFEDVDLANFEN